MSETIGIYLGLRAFVGTIAGLLGVGGGLIIVSVLVFVFRQQHIDAALMIHLAIGTSLATIFFTAISSVRAHQRRGAVRWTVFWQLAPGIATGALLGSWLASWLPAWYSRPWGRRWLTA